MRTLCGVLVVCVAAGCSSVLAAPPAVGDTAADFELKTPAGQAVKLSTFAGDGPVVLVVLRGYPGYQCPACSKQVTDLAKHAEQFKSAGAKVLLVYPGPSAKLTDKATEFLGDRSLPDHFALVTDPDYTFTNLYQLRWDAKNETAYPATFVLGKDRKVVFAAVSKSHGGRTDADAVLKAIPAK
jgi:thioredoxin-dependent peroxiredoxin